MTKTPETPARIISIPETWSIIRNLSYWDDGIKDFAYHATSTLRELKGKLETPTHDNLPAIRAEINSLIETQQMIQIINTDYQNYLHELKERFSRSFTILDVLRGTPEK